MQKKKILICLSMLQMALLLFILCAIPVEAAGHYMITVKDSGKLSSNEQLIFEETYIAPGFQSNYQIEVDNQYKEAVNVYVEDIKVKTTAPTAKDFSFSFNGNTSVETAGGIGDFHPSSSSILTVPSNASEKIDVGFRLLESAGNEYQNQKFDFYITLRVVSDDSVVDDDIGGDGKGTGGKPIDSVKTSDDARILFWTVVLLSSALCLLIIWRRRKQREKTAEE